jgi:hypothetical protein
MINYLPHEQVVAEPVTPSLHTTLNRSVKDLGVVCTGAASGTLYFDRQSRAAKEVSPAQLAQSIISIIMAQPEVVEWMQRASITSITIR